MTANLQGRNAGASVPRFELLVMLAFCLSACGGGGGGGVSLAEGQGPDPVVLDVPIAYVKRPLPLDDNGDLLDSDIREVTTFDIGADLFVRDRASPSAEERNVTGEITAGLGDVRDLDVSFDGKKVTFAMRAQFIEGADEEVLGRGLSAYARRDAERIIGHKSREIWDILGYRGRTELIHRDDMALERKR